MNKIDANRDMPVLYNAYGTFASSINEENLTRVRDFLHLYILYKKYKKYYNNILQFGKICVIIKSG